MPNILSAIRRMKKTKVQTAINKIRKSKYKSTIKQMSSLIEAGKVEEAKVFLPTFYSRLMKIAKTGTIRKKTASRKISKFTKKIQSLKK
ncbi:30S ribosomal protein S20 [Pelagibacteraceae bacterium]|nr:30S ribosomal protein S20 [Pelagibacteraceae bacterium]